MTAYTGQRVRRSMSLAERIAFYSTARPSGCIEWTGSTDGKAGYGKLNWQGRMQYAHRLSWEQRHGAPIPDGFVIRHRCDNPPCVNPDHMDLGTQLENVADQASRGRMRRLTGEQHPLARVTDVEADEIRSAVAAGESQASAARRYRISGTSVWRIVNHIAHQPRSKQ